MEFLLAWTLTCTQYNDAVQRLYADPYFQQPEHHVRRQEIHEIFKSKTRFECIEIEI